MSRSSLATCLAVLAAAWGSLATAPAIAAAQEATPHAEVLVFGSPHLRQLECDPSAAMDRARAGLSAFRPEHVVVEWLHPSIDPAQTGNYEPFPDLDSLAAAWNGPGADAGRRHYLKRDMLNAGYQWWLAGSGAEPGDIARATLDRFEGHELEVLGFAIAREQRLDYITPFDYVGEGHKPFLEDEFRRRGFTVVPATDFLP